MEDIELVIKMNKKYYDIIKEQVKNGDTNYSPFVVIANGTPIDKYEPCITMSKAFAHSVTFVKILKDENEELKNKINNIIDAIDFAIKATDSQDDYDMGMRNGMRYVKSLIDDKEPQYELSNLNNTESEVK